ncbi:MAG TPA: CHAD domain-containing protein [Blastocatellia bacterium]|nr:CHAD domain-containing protein [Blastocatellia bacterium]
MTHQRPVHFKLLRTETLPEGMRRIAREQVARAIERLATPEPDMDDAIHDARLCFKKTRAVLRLVREELGEALFQQENTHYRDAGRRLSAVRDTAAMVEILSKLAQQFPDNLKGPWLEDLRTHFLMVDKTEVDIKKFAMAEVSDMLRSAREWIDNWPLTRKGSSILSEGFKLSYAQGRRRYHKASHRPTPENLHEWRKHVKYLWYQVSILSPIKPKALGRFANQLRKLADYLSDYHDLIVLRDMIPQRATTLPNPSKLNELTPIIDDTCTRLEKRAHVLGRRIYAESPREFVHRLRDYWTQYKKPN